MKNIIFDFRPAEYGIQKIPWISGYNPGSFNDLAVSGTAGKDG